MVNYESSKSDEFHFLKGVLIFIAWVTIIYQMVTTRYIFQSSIEHQIIHLGLVLLLISLDAAINTRSKFEKYFWIILILLSLLSTGYMKIFYNHLEKVVGFPETIDIIIGLILILIVIISTLKSWGLVFPVIAVSFIIYFFLGHLLPQPLFHPKIPVSLAVSYLDIGLSGIFGSLLAVMADYGFLLVFFGSLLELMGAVGFFIEIGKLAGRVTQGGPAQTSVVSSSLVGMASGSAIANVIIDGYFTIPMMKKMGYKAEVAGGIEAAASTGGQLMPPIMGTAAFLMAGILGKPYSEIMIAGIIPALLYYLGVGLSIELYARKYQIIPQRMEVDLKIIFERGLLFIVPLGFLTILLVMRKSEGFATFYAILLLLFLGLVQKATRPSFRALAQGIVRGSVSAAKISIVIATVAMMSQVIITTGLGGKLTYIVGIISGGNLLITLIMTMILVIILGCGLPTAAAYFLTVIMVAPAIVKMGVPVFQVHFFCFYYAVIAAITPPVALASMAAAAIAESDYWKTGLEGFKLTLTGFIIPFFIIFNPIFIMKYDNVIELVLNLIAGSSAIFFLSVASYGYLLYKISFFLRISMIFCTILLGGYIVTSKIPMFYMGVFLGTILVLKQAFENKRRNQLEVSQKFSLGQKS